MSARRRRGWAVLAWIAGLCGASCGPSLFRVPLDACPVKLAPQPAGGKVVVQYLGVGGFLLKRGSDVILTAPLYSNPSILEVAFNHDVRSDPDVIDRLFPQDADAAKAILVGHSHYDHLMDVPYVALHRAKGADIYGSETAARLLAPIVPALRAKAPATRIVPLDHVAGDAKSPGLWQTVGSGARFMALRSEHSPLFTLKLRVPFERDVSIPFHLWRGGGLSEDAKELPRTASEWLQGPVFAFVIDFLDAAGRPAFRIYYQDSGNEEGIRAIPEALLKEKGVDLAIVCLGGDTEALAGRPVEDILKTLKPQAVVVAHWENFFVSQDIARAMGGFHAIPSASMFQAVDIKRFVQRIKSALQPTRTPYYVPCPTRSVFEFEIR